MIKNITLAILLLLSAECTLSDQRSLVPDLENQSGISVDIQASSEIHASEIDTFTYIDEEPSFPLIFLLILGWVLPDPARLYQWFINLLMFWIRKK